MAATTLMSGTCKCCGQLVRRTRNTTTNKLTPWAHVGRPRNNAWDEFDHKPVPAVLHNTNAYLDADNDEEREAVASMWAEGFRPMQAQYLYHHDVVAFRETDVFQLGPVGPVGYTTVEDVALAGYVTDPKCKDYGTPPVRVSTWDRGVVECDDGDEVWVKVAS